MSNSNLRKMSPTRNDMKSTTQGTTRRQQGFLELNKRRTFLQDNSWIKNRPEEERDENYGRVVLSRHNSHDALDRKINERNELKATISRYRSDDALDRHRMSTFRSPEATKTQPAGCIPTSTPPSTSATTPVKKKRQSWFPPPPPGYNATPSTGASRREPAAHPPIPPKPTSPALSPNQLKRDNRQTCPPAAGVNTETRSAERPIRRQDLENIVKVATSLQKTGKGKEMDNIIKRNKSLNRNQGLDGIFRATPREEQTEKRAKSLENLIFLNIRPDKNGKGNQGLASLVEVNQRTDKNEKENQDLSGHIKVNPETNKNIKRGQSLDNLIKVAPDVNRNNPGYKDLDNLIEVNSRTEKTVQGGQSLDNFIKVAPETNRAKQRSQDLNNLIKVTPAANKRSEQGLNELINVSPKAVKNAARNQDLDKLIKVNPETLTNNQRNQDLKDLIKGNAAVIRSNQSHDLDNLIKAKPSAFRNMEKLDGQVSGPTDALNNQSPRTTAYSHEARKNFSSNAETRSAGPKDTVVYTRTYVENSKSPKDGYQENLSRKYIQTVYSTSDRSIIEKDMCTYCRKPLGTKTKMILNELQICCHSTCFKCEICKQPLENLQAGDSIWIYRQTIHCEPCYSKVVAKWIQ